MNYQNETCLRGLSSMKFSKLLVIGLMAVLVVSSVSSVCAMGEWKEPRPRYIKFDLGSWDAYLHVKGFSSVDDNTVIQQVGGDHEWMCVDHDVRLNPDVARVKIRLKPFHANQNGNWFRQYDQDASRGIYVDYCNTMACSEIYVYYYDTAGNPRTFHTSPKTNGDGENEAWI
jgi:hypothetical protein